MQKAAGYQTSAAQQLSDSPLYDAPYSFSRIEISTADSPVKHMH